ncbi:MAG: cytochrome c3 family protein [Pseudomonadales bacterium]
MSLPLPPSHLLVTLCFLLFVYSEPGKAASLETLVMPGKLTVAHAELESDCSQCHSNFSAREQQTLCLDCHKGIRADLSEQQGYHGHSTDITSEACSTCHTEHKGRNADIAGLIPETFDHSLTNFPLDGGHENTSCTGCHENDKPHREAPTICADCHAESDPHRGNLGSECGDCHRSSGWQQTTFDHSLASDFNLTGAHATVQCASCHSNQTYETTTSDCHSCHRLDDLHNGNRGAACESCHTTESWKTQQFNHLEITQFKLQSAHSTLQCSSCHLDDMALENPPKTCAGCHSTNDPHLGRNGTACADCHSQENWKVTFDHLESTGFALKNGHQSLTCGQCHEGALTSALPTECSGCHADDNPHGDALNQCGDCHSSTNWRKNITFHHELTRFSLIGAHRLATCEQCHDGLRFSAREDSTSCVDCHSDAGSHDGSMGNQCATCHTPATWSQWRFDHDKQTDFSLTGSHESLACDGCHTTGRSKTPPSTCRGCHRQDDVHRGAFGPNCSNCHSTDSFQDANMERLR